MRFWHGLSLLVLLTCVSCHQDSKSSSKTSSPASSSESRTDQANASSAVQQAGDDADEESEDLKSGEIAAAFELEDLSGAKRTLESFRGKLVLINFWATWCVPCVKEMPALERLYKQFKDRGFEIVAISGDQEKESVQKFVHDHGVSFTVLVDTENDTPNAYEVTGFPESVFVSPEGKLISIVDPETHQPAVRIVSDRPWDAPAFQAIVEKLLPK